MHDLLLDDYQTFIASLNELTFQLIRNKFIEHANRDEINKYVGQYIPKLHQYEPEFDQHKKEEELMKKIPSFNGKKEY